MRQIAKAKENGREIDRDTAFEEVVADSMETMLTQGNIGQMMAELKQQDKTLWEKVREWFRNLADSLKAVADEYRGTKPESPEGRLVAQMDDFVKVLQQAYAEALVEAGEYYRANEGNKKTTREGGDVRYMARASGKEVVHIKDVIKASSVDLNSMNPVATVTTADLTKMNTNQRYKWAVDILKATGFRVDRQNFGVINFSEKQINTGLNYLNTPGEVAAFATLPQVLKRGKIIYDDNNHKGRNFGTVVIAAPVEINGVRGNMGVALQRTSATHYHTHRILMPDGSAFEFKINAALTPSGGSDKTSIIAPAISTASNDKVTQQKPVVNPKSMEKRSDRDLEAEDVKLSDRDAGAEKVAAALERQNAKLKADVADLRELVRLQGKLTHGTEFTKSSIEAAMRSLTKTAMAKLDAEGRQQLSGMLKDFYRYIATDKELAWEGVTEKAGQIADFLMDNVTIKPQRDGYADEVLRNLRGARVRLSDSQRAEVEKLYGYENYRKMLFGAGIYISRNGEVL